MDFSIIDNRYPDHTRFFMAKKGGIGVIRESSTKTMIPYNQPPSYNTWLTFPQDEEQTSYCLLKPQIYHTNPPPNPPTTQPLPELIHAPNPPPTSTHHLTPSPTVFAPPNQTPHRPPRPPLSPSSPPSAHCHHPSTRPSLPPRPPRRSDKRAYSSMYSRHTHAVGGGRLLRDGMGVYRQVSAPYLISALGDISEDENTACLFASGVLRRVFTDG